ncbi:MinD/ParA family protein [Natrialba sp. INN-245]|uniref:MinD/ParA family ATP-binding protein n=1 Tax=Natrialba sp. INN-245 TaxID=2690967 RepID=UPI001311E7CA|nr:MinD/ParA family protein [Natrialba sp. INN-245]MWV41430.1 P-loop NTPase [Natrialba sp. INN-245]
MIAIAGAKGGCGKTTVTAGLAEAFARAGEPTIAVDADRQLPNLHVVADVDRTPTIADAVGSDVSSATHPLPGEVDASVLTAPKSSDRVDLEAAFDRLARVDARVLLDCPSGAGPDVTDPLCAADRVVVVTTNTERSRRASRRTIEMARRLEIPVAGAVVTRSDGVTGAVESSLGVPVLGTIPERDDPLAADGVREAFDAVAGTLRGDEPAEISRHDVESDGDRLPTGIRPLDTALAGGVSAGSVVALTADPASQSEHLLADVAKTRGTLYLTTNRSKRNVRRALEPTLDGATPTVRRITGENRLEDATELIAKLPDGANLVVDSMDPLERTDHEAYLEFLNTLVDEIADSGGLAVLHCLSDDPVPDHRSTTMQLVDIVATLRTFTGATTGGVEHALSLPKLRERRFTETVDLDLGRSATDARIEPGEIR